MVTGIDRFRDWFHGYEEQYAIIGGTACDLLMSEEGMDFRATKDIDLVLIVEAITPDFGRRFWQFVQEAGYEHSLIWVQPYETAEYRQHESDYLAYYDEVQICDSTHYKSAFQQRNRAMIDRSDLVIVYVDRQSGGAYQSLRYAQKHHKQVVNLCEDTAVHT